MTAKLADDKRLSFLDAIEIPTDKSANADTPSADAVDWRMDWDSTNQMAERVTNVLNEMTCEGKEPIPPDVTLFIQTMTALRVGAGVDARGRCKMPVTVAAKEALDQFEYVNALVS